MLGERLKKIFELCPSCECMADIGTDHGYLPVELVRSGKVMRAVACDISLPSLKKAEKNILYSGLSSKIETRLGNGLEKIGRGEAGCIVIAGMGGNLIAQILKAAYDKLNDEQIILQPMTSVPDMRRELIDSGFCITDEEMAEEDTRLYNIVCVKRGEMKEYDCENGSILFEKRNPLLKKQLEIRISKTKAVIAGIETANPDNPSLEELKQKLLLFENLLERW